MTKYQKSVVTVTGGWVKASEVPDGSVAKLVSETKPIPSSFTNKDGSPKTQDVAKIRFKHLPDSEALNISLNRVTINGLVDAFGEDSANWQGHYLTVKTMPALISGKMQTVIYLIPEGYKLGVSDTGYPEIQSVTPKENVVTDDEQPRPKAEDLPF